MNVHDDLLQVTAAAVILDESPTDEVVQQLSDSGEELSVAESECNGLSRNANQVAGITESLESYVNSVFDTVSAESWSPRVARQFEVGMSNILGSAGLSVPRGVYCASFEDASTTQTNEENRTESKEKSGNFLVRVYNAFIEAVKSWIKSARNWFTMLGKSADAIALAGKNLAAQCQGLDDAKTPGKIGGGYLAYLNGATNGASALNSLGATALVSVGEWLKLFEDATTAVKTSVQQGKPLGDTLHISTDWERFEKKWAGGVETVVKSKIGTAGLGGTVDKLSSVSVEVKKDGGEKAKDINIMSVAEIKSLATALGKVAESMKHVEDLVSKSITKIEDLVKVVTEKSKSKDAGTGKLGKGDLKGMTAIITNTNLYPQKLAGIMGSAGKMAFAHGKACIGAHKAGGGTHDKDAKAKEEHIPDVDSEVVEEDEYKNKKKG